ncbi:ESPR-type extended signal peptide-containing protein [Vulcaniibacterium tengchongense]|uniref:Trimeric autotransporter adhesin n=1 Tax=Vulcaniibacterium tengchongense TaxID=1273429 RepID=A0A3N4VF29_9GAMM|nr:ESPR-type extended signal peptide-containing protein [Vulcaniibacterium tengchongense]RPE81582.1 trimeric autotransporter adhesin [Vulcaniibacterium tengchongense]
MNTIYRIVWNASVGKWVVASEFAKGRKKGGAKAKGLALAVALALPAGGAFAADACTTQNGEAGLVDETGACKVAAQPVAADAAVAGTSGYAGIMAQVDDAYVKVNGTGSAATANGATGIAIGNGAVSRQAINSVSGSGTAVGASSDAAGDFSTALGSLAVAGARGSNGVATASAATAVGVNANAIGDRSTAMGASAVAAGGYSTALGVLANVDATAANGVAVGVSANVKAGATNGVALGNGATVNDNVTGSVALGAGSLAARNNTVSVGSDTVKRQIVNVAAGTQDTDAVNVKQLNDATAYFDAKGGTYGSANASASAGNATAVGASAVASALSATALGSSAQATAQNTVAVGIMSAASGNNSVAVGWATEAAGESTALGGDADALASGATAIGRGAKVQAGATNSTALGIGAVVNQNVTGAVALGSGSVADRANTVSVGSGTVKRQIANVAAGTQDTDAVNVKQLNDALATQVDDTYVKVKGTSGAAAKVSGLDGNIALGYGADSSSSLQNNSVAIGTAAKAANNGAIAIGQRTAASGSGAMAFGVDATAESRNGLALGVRSVASGGNDTTALGVDSAATHTNGVALGAYSVTDRDNSVSVGDASKGLYRQITGVAAGTVDTDAVNLGQLKGAAGSIADAIGGGAAVNPDGSISAPTYNVGGTTVNSVGDAITNIDGRVTGNTTQIGELTNQFNEFVTNIGDTVVGEVGAVVYDDKAAKDRITLGGAEGTALTNLKDGELSAASTDAVTGAQLFATNERVGVVEGDITTINTNLGDLDARVTVNEGSITEIRNELADGSLGLVRQDADSRAITVAAGTDGTVVDFAGTAGARTLRGVAAGAVSADSTEAVNGAQLFETNARLGAVETGVGELTNQFNEFVTNIGDTVVGDIGAVVYDDKAAKDRITLGGAEGTALTNLKDGELSAASTDAVTGKQLHATNEKVQENADAIADLDTAVTHIDDRVTNIDGRVTNNTNQLTEISNKLENGSIGLVQQDAATGAITVAAGTGGGVVNVEGTDGARRLTGVANGREDADAATIAQLKAMGLVDPDGNPLAAVAYDDVSLGKVTLGGTGGTVITNLAPGVVGKGSTDAINGGQLYDLQQSLEGKIGDLDNRVGTIEQGIADGSIGGGDGGNGGGDWNNDAGGQPIQNVGNGVKDTDAANVGQLNERLQQAKEYTDSRFNALQSDFDSFRQDVDQRFGEVDKRIDRMSAISAAYAGMAINTAGLPGRNRLGVGIGAQNGKEAMAVGYQRVFGRQGNVSVSIGGAFSGNETSVSAGAGFGW